VVGFDGEIMFDNTKPDGTPQKLLDVTKINALGWGASTTPATGIACLYQYYLQAYHNKNMTLVERRADASTITL
jgi:GDP-L-fucose synthase